MYCKPWLYLCLKMIMGQYILANLNPHGWIINVGTHFKVNQLHSNQLQPLRHLFRLEQERITVNDTVPARVGGLSYKRLFKQIKTSQFRLNILKPTRITF